MEQYARRLTNQITTPNPTLIGLSFGGMLAVEVAKLIPSERVVLLASAKTRSEIPVYFRLAGALHLHKLLPARLLTETNQLIYWLFGVKTNSNKELLSDILHDTDPIFLKWAINAMVTWRNVAFPNNVFHIHGTEDRILPICFIRNSVPVVGGRHMMTLECAPAISLILQQVLDS
jgi:pimeloyl-ACP methyl ester carboxylesterase